MWIERLTLKDFRGFAELELDLDRAVTVLVGVNGSGKSSVLDAIAIVVRPQIETKTSARLDGRLLESSDLRQGTSLASIRLGVRYPDGAYESGVSGHIAGGTLFRTDEWNATGFGARDGGTIPLVLHVRSPRALSVADVLVPPRLATTRQQRPGLAAIDDALEGSLLAFAPFVAWYREQEDVENERRRDGQPDHEDPLLSAVRRALLQVVPEYTDLRVRRLPSPHLTVRKAGVTLSLTQLSEGEKNLLALVGDIARRMAIADPTADDPLQTEAVILIDEIELHLHPAWQRRVLPRLRAAFPRSQFIVTTHSPQVVASVPAESVVVLKDFVARRQWHPTEGRDSNAILREVFGDPSRPQEAAAEIDAVRALIDAEQLDEARARLKTLAAKFSEQDDDVLDLRTRLDFAEVGL